MNSLSMVTFFTRERYLELSNLPPSIVESVFANLPSHTDGCGNAIYEEQAVDDRVRQVLGRGKDAPATPPYRQLGRKPTTQDDAILAEQLHDSGYCWKDVAPRVNDACGTPGKYNARSIRAAVYRLKKREGRL